MASPGVLLVLSVAWLANFATGSALVGDAQKKSENGLKAGMGPGGFDFVKSDMHQLLSDETEDDVDLTALVHDRRFGPKPAHTGFLQAVIHANMPTGVATITKVGTPANDYLAESEASLSRALGPRWNSRKIEDDADQSSGALLRGIASPRAMAALRGLTR